MIYGSACKRGDLKPPPVSLRMPHVHCVVQHMYWTGYFTSRPALKRLERVTRYTPTHGPRPPAYGPMCLFVHSRAMSTLSAPVMSSNYPVLNLSARRLSSASAASCRECGSWRRWPCCLPGLLPRPPWPASRRRRPWCSITTRWPAPPSSTSPTTTRSGYVTRRAAGSHRKTVSMPCPIRTGSWKCLPLPRLDLARACGCVAAGHWVHGRGGSSVVLAGVTAGSTVDQVRALQAAQRVRVCLHPAGHQRRPAHQLPGHQRSFSPRLALLHVAFARFPASNSVMAYACILMWCLLNFFCRLGRWWSTTRWCTSARHPCACPSPPPPTPSTSVRHTHTSPPRLTSSLNESCCLPTSVCPALVVSGEEEVPCDVITTEASPHSNAAPYTLVFQATHVPPVGIKTYAHRIALPLNPMFAYAERCGDVWVQVLGQAQVGR